MTEPGEPEEHGESGESGGRPREPGEPAEPGGAHQPTQPGAAPVPITSARLRSFAYLPAGTTDLDSGTPIDIAEEFHEGSEINAATPGDPVGAGGAYPAPSPTLPSPAAAPR